ncbi:hypothetical protein MMC25_007564 [Agyrium rufum]|nr:hypothetical protein [Agyrium rufum]
MAQAQAHSLAGTDGHATRAGLTEAQHFEYDFSAAGGFPQQPKFEDKYEHREYLKGRLAAAFRIIGQKGFDEGVAGHVTIRDPVDLNTFWVNPFGVSFNYMRRSDLQHVDWDGKVLNAGSVRLVNRAAIMIHAAVYKHRPDVWSACHTHSIYGRAFSTLRRILPITTQDACAFHNDIALSFPFEGIVLAGDEGEHLAKAIGNRKALILQNHGMLTVSDTVEATIFWYISLEKCCQTVLLAEAAAACSGTKIPEVGDGEAAETYKTVGRPMSGWFAAQPMFDAIARETHEDYLA